MKNATAGISASENYNFISFKMDVPYKEHPFYYIFFENRKLKPNNFIALKTFS